MLLPERYRTHKPVMVTVTLPSNWMAEYFLDWVATEFPEAILGNEGQHLKAAATGTTIVFERETEASSRSGSDLT